MVGGAFLWKETSTHLLVWWKPFLGNFLERLTHFLKSTTTCTSFSSLCNKNMYCKFSYRYCTWGESSSGTSKRHLSRGFPVLLYEMEYQCYVKSEHSVHISDWVYTVSSNLQREVPTSHFHWSWGWWALQKEKQNAINYRCCMQHALISSQVLNCFKYVGQKPHIVLILLCLYTLLL